MHPRLQLAAFLTAVLVLCGAIGVALSARGGDRPAAAGSGDPATGFRGAVRPAIPPRDFALRDEGGERVRLSALRGQVVVLTFLYTTCDDTCPTAASQIAGALDDLEAPAPALAVSVDPADDTADRAQRFLVERGLRGRMRFLLGSRAELAPVWRHYGIQPQGEGFEHSAYVLVIDKAGRQRVGFPVSKLVPEDLAHDIRVLQRERS